MIIIKLNNTQINYIKQYISLMYSKNLKLFVVSLFLLAGTISTFAYKLQSTVDVTQGTQTKKFFHPYMQTLTMFIGQAFCIIIYLMDSKRQVVLQQGKTHHRPWIFIIPAIADTCSSILQYMGLGFVSGSTYMMIKGASIVTTAIFSKVLIKMTLQKRHYVGCGMAILGIVIVGASGLIQSDSKGDSTFDKQFIGYVFMIVSLVFNGFLFAYQQFLLKKHSINPMQMVGFEGIFGLIIIFIVTTILSFVPCTFGQNCVFDQNNEAFIQLPLVFFQQVFQHIQLLIMMIFGIIAVGVFNLNGLKITKMFDALTRSLLNVSKTTVIWIIGIIITLIAEGNPDFKLESLNIGVNLVKVVGFAVIITGTLIYNQLLFKNYFASEVDEQQNKKNYSSLISQSSSTLSEDLLKKDERIE